MISTKIQRTYGSRKRSNHTSSLVPPSSPASGLASSPPASPEIKRPSKRNFSDMFGTENTAPLFSSRKRAKLPLKPSTSAAKAQALIKNKLGLPKAIGQQKTLTQLHFNIDQSILRTCSLCDLSYTKGAPDDEALHRAHCARVRQGLEWGREEEKERLKENLVIEIRSDVKLKTGKKKGRILCLPADIGGKLGAKLTTLLQTINLSLSAPALPPSVLQCSKAYLFLLPHETLNHRERIVGCVIAQRISTAMAIVSPPLPSSEEQQNQEETPRPIAVDAETNLYCSPLELPTPMGIPRLFVSSSHRRLGISRALLDAAAATFIHGCALNPLSGQIAFSQPTGMGQAVMKSWGRGNIRVFEE